MTDLALLRKIYGSVYVTALPDGRHIPWKLLSIKDYLEIEALRVAGTYTQGQLEDEVFRRCVLDPLIIEKMDQLKAGTVETVAVAILGNSGPQSVDELNYSLHINRSLIQNAMHQMISMTCQAFPGYTPDDLYEMDYETLVQRAALAEDKLLRTGVIPEKVVFEQKERKPQQQRRTDLDSKQLFDRYEQQRKPTPQPPSKTTIITTGDMMEAEAAYTGHERSDKILRETQMVDEAAGIYDDYVRQMKDGEKVIIPSHEERVRAAKARAEENKKKYEATLKGKSETDNEEWQKLLEVKKKAQVRKARRRRQRR